MPPFSEWMNLLDAMPAWAGIVAALTLSFVLLFLIKRIILSNLKRLTDKTSYHFDSLVVHALARPLTLVVIAINLLFFVALLTHFNIVNADVNNYANLGARIILVAAVVLFIDRLAFGGIERYSGQSEMLRNSKNLVQGLSRILIVGLGALVLLGTLGISVTPVIASLGITSLAVALALQPTLENFFSGVQLIADKPIRVGDFIELESGEQGFVEKIGWRSTWIKMLPNNFVIMPNSVLSQSKIINYYYPVKELSVPVEVGVHYDSDLEHVEKVTLEVARHILKTHEWGVSNYETFVLFHTFDSSSINFTVMLRAKEYFNRFFIKSAFLKALHARYAEEGIVIPYPIRAINTSQEKPGFAVDQRQSMQPRADAPVSAEPLS